MPATIEVNAPSHLEPGQVGEVVVQASGLADQEYHLVLVTRGGDGEGVQRTEASRPIQGRLAHTFELRPKKVGAFSLRAELCEGHKTIRTSATQKVTVTTMSEAKSVDSAIGGGGGGNGGGGNGVARVALQRSSVPQTEDEVLWMAIRHSCANLSYPRYTRFIEELLCRGDNENPVLPTDDEAVADRKLHLENLNHLAKRRALPFPGVDGYRWLKVATEMFVMASCGVVPRLGKRDVQDAEGRMGTSLTGELGSDPEAALSRYLGSPPASHDDEMLPYLRIVMEKLQGERVLRPDPERHDDGKVEACYGILERKLRYPCMIELVWSYWHEEGMLVQTLNAISRRFQNRQAPGGPDPLAQLEIDALRPLNNLLWGYIQDEQHRLSVVRRALEYDHQYGFSLHGKAVPATRSADSRSKFLESFHNLLYKCTQFYKQDDDATVIADGFPVLNALKETHYVLAQGAANQFGDLPSTARQEMLMQQWLVARPEMREFLGSRVMVPHPEPWMDRVDAMKTLQGWSDTGVVHFHDLGSFGEQVLLSIRYGAWSLISNRDHAANWARSWRTEIQGYIHAYRAATGVDLAVDPSSVRNAEERYLPPSVHLRNRLASQRRR
jgi:hypothetical protein